MRALFGCAGIFGHPLPAGEMLQDHFAVSYFYAVGCRDADAVRDVLVQWMREGSRFPLPVDVRQELRARGVALDAGAASDGPQAGAAEGGDQS